MITEACVECGTQVPERSTAAEHMADCPHWRAANSVQNGVNMTTNKEHADVLRDIGADWDISTVDNALKAAIEVLDPQPPQRPSVDEALAMVAEAWDLDDPRETAAVVVLAIEVMRLRSLLDLPAPEPCPDCAPGSVSIELNCPECGNTRVVQGDPASVQGDELEREHCLNAVRDSSGITIREQVDMLIRERAAAIAQERDHHQAELNALYAKLEALRARYARLDSAARAFHDEHYLSHEPEKELLAALAASESASHQEVYERLDLLQAENERLRTEQDTFLSGHVASLKAENERLRTRHNALLKEACAASTCVGSDYLRDRLWCAFKESEPYKHSAEVCWATEHVNLEALRLENERLRADRDYWTAQTRDAVCRGGELKTENERLREAVSLDTELQRDYAKLQTKHAALVKAARELDEDLARQNAEEGTDQLQSHYRLRDALKGEP